MDAIQQWMKRGQVMVVWQVGTFDGKPTEFGLAPDRAREFAQRFLEKVFFTVGQSPLSDFPFIHPSEADTAWGGQPILPFVLRFDLSQVGEGTYALVLALTDTHERLSSTMEVTLNGQKVWERKMPLGRGRAFFGDLQGAPRLFVVPLLTESLRTGRNELTITLRGGSWVAYDALALVRWKGAQIDVPPAPPLREGFREMETERFSTESGLVLPLTNGFQAMLLPGGTVTLEQQLPSDGFEAEFLLRPCGGKWKLTYTLPEGARGSAWQLQVETGAEGSVFRLAETPLSRALTKNAVLTVRTAHKWLRFSIHHLASATELDVCTDDGEVLSGALVHPPTPDGTLRWQADETGAELQVAHLRWRPLPPQAQTEAIITSPPAKVKPRKRPTVHFNPKTGAVRLTNRDLELLIETKDGLNPRRLRDLRTGRFYADSDYIWQGGKAPQLVGKPQVKKQRDGSASVAFTARWGSLEVQQTFTAPAKEPDVLMESLRVRNVGKQPLDISDFACGFAKRVCDGQRWFLDTAMARFSAIPYRRDTETGELVEHTLPELVWRSGWYHTHSRQPKVLTPAWGSEGWAWCDGGRVLLLVKYNPDAMEWSLLEPSWQQRGDRKKARWEMVLRFGGAGRWKRGDPEGAARLEPGQTFTFGTTRLQLLDGDWKDAFYAFRSLMERLGHRTPKGYNPPVHWNELYDNPLWWGPDTPERRAQFYRREDMLVEAEKAQELGCEALYLDPGWDTSFASSIWDEKRLGQQDEFARLLKERYGLVLAFHTPLAGWSDVKAYPVEARRMDPEGNRLGSLCSASPAYVETKAQRLIELCSKGAAFLMFDGSAFTGECWDQTHGHSLPLTRQEHCEAYLRIAQKVHQAFPDVLIELHDPIVAGVNVRYAPTYFLHAKPGSFDELWGYEYMWDPMEDLFSRRAMSLYYVRLAYSIPIYLHIDLRKDNEHAFEFWWYASTCQHLGIGGKHLDPKVWEAHRQAMRTYLRLKRFYTQGIFYGLDETVHAHTLPDEGESVLNVFNFADLEVEREIRFRPRDIGLSRVPVRIEGAPAQVMGEEVTLWVCLPARGHRLIELKDGTRNSR